MLSVLLVHAKKGVAGQGGKSMADSMSLQPLHSSNKTHSYLRAYMREIAVSFIDSCVSQTVLCPCPGSSHLVHPFIRCSRAFSSELTEIHLDVAVPALVNLSLCPPPIGITPWSWCR
jgi:hypothetical protein